VTVGACRLVLGLHCLIDTGKLSLPFKSVETPVAKRPRDATASEPPRSTMQASVPPWRMLRRFCHGGGISISPGSTYDGSKSRASKQQHTVCICLISSSKLTVPGRAAVTRSCS
jgi:hypothetical protein